MEKADFKKYYCENCVTYFSEPAKFKENRTPNGEKSDDTWYEHLDGCPICHEGLEVRYLCPKCGKFKSDIDYYPYADEFMCNDCYEEMMEIGELVENELERLGKNE